MKVLAYDGAGFLYAGNNRAKGKSWFYIRWI